MNVDVFGPDFNSQSTPMKIWKAFEDEIQSGKLNFVKWSAGLFFFPLLAFAFINITASDELILLPGTVEFNAVPLVVNSKGHVLRTVMDASVDLKLHGKRKRSDLELPVDTSVPGDDVFLATMLEDQSPHHSAMDGIVDVDPDIQFLGYRIDDESTKIRNTSSFRTPQLKAVEGLLVDGTFDRLEKGEGWLRNGLRDSPGLEENIWPGHYKGLYAKPPIQSQPQHSRKPVPQVPSKQGLVIKTGGRGEMGPFAYSHLSVGANHGMSSYFLFMRMYQ